MSGQPYYQDDQVTLYHGWGYCLACTCCLFREQFSYDDSMRQKITLPDPHLIAPGALITVGGNRWECVREGKHAFWEKKK